MSPTFHSMRLEFGTTFSKIRDAIKETSITLENLKGFLKDCYPDIGPQLACSSCNSLDGILEIFKEKCTLIDVGILKAFAKRYAITKVDIEVKAYENAIEEFCRTVTTRLCLQESLMVSKSSPVKCETVKFVLEWDPDKT